MDKAVRRTERTTVVIRHEMLNRPGENINMKHWSFLYASFLEDFKITKSRYPDQDNDWWIESTDESIALCFVKETVEPS